MIRSTAHFHGLRTPGYRHPDVAMKDDLEKTPATVMADTPYSVLFPGEKIFVVLVGSFAALISPLSSSIYLRALNSLARDMNMSVSLINLTITIYLIFQGLAPSFNGSFFNGYGRRLAYIIAFEI
ncbi:hypothetical protein N7532_000936 [Penicillium argentinense]|uniref:Major facilitator superfamily (MFS) profile domain-containing protein n=1 Tax=Penicillium argentinense TaxID=1131581 RepID=A0A9W9KLY7_9EURO|nr:uncharacterized protein N7532_000936 [Penicillium argentinense]KAJ5110401.1 hypothetical protein N7532_000936 [Penicillium argentinense]